MSYNEIINLIELDTELDELGVDTDPEVISTPVYCKRKSASSAAFNAARQGGNARQEGKCPEYVFTIRRFEYSNQRFLDYNGNRYEIERTYEIGHDELELHTRGAIGI